LYKSSAGNISPAEKPWSFADNQQWMNSGFWNASLKHIFFGAPNPLLIIHEICLAVSTYGHGTRSQNRMQQAAETASQYDPGLFRKNQDSGWDVSKNSA
jgi:hypothetical protein